MDQLVSGHGGSQMTAFRKVMASSKPTEGNLKKLSAQLICRLFRIELRTFTTTTRTFLFQWKCFFFYVAECAKLSGRAMCRPSTYDTICPEESAP